MTRNNNVIWITGASSGIGKSLAIELSRQNTKLILSSRNKIALDAVKSLCDNKEEIFILPLDLENEMDFDLKVKQGLAHFGHLDMLINNGGISQRSYATETSIEVDKKLMAVNYIGTVGLTKTVLPYFVTQKRGHIVVVTSIVGKIGTPLRSSYAATKHALHGFFDSLRAEVYKDNIKITLVCPGFVNTNVSKNALTGDGSPQMIMDSATANGIHPDRFAKLMLKAIEKNKEEINIAGVKEKLAVFVKRFYPKLLSTMIRKMKVT